MLPDGIHFEWSVEEWLGLLTVSLLLVVLLWRGGIEFERKKSG